MGFCTCYFLCFRTFFPQIIQRICFFSSLAYMKPYCEVFPNILTHFVYYSLPSPCLIVFLPLPYLTSSILLFIYGLSLPPPAHYPECKLPRKDLCFLCFPHCSAPHLEQCLAHWSCLRSVVNRFFCQGRGGMGVFPKEYFSHEFPFSTSPIILRAEKYSLLFISLMIAFVFLLTILSL